MRRDGQLPSDGVWIDIDSRQSGVGAFHFSVNAAGRAERRHPLQRHQVLDRLGRGLGGEGRRHRPRLRDRVPHPAVGAAVLGAAGAGAGGSRSAASSTRARRPTTGRSTPRSAVSYVPLFGRIDNLVGLRPRGTASSCARSCSGSVGHRSAGADASSPTARRRGASAGLDAKAHLTNELTLDLDREPRLRPGRGRRRRPQPLDVRDVLPREAAVLPRGHRRLRRACVPCSTRAASAASPRCRRWRRRDAGREPRAVDDLWRGQAVGHDRGRDPWA